MNSVIRRQIKEVFKGFSISSLIFMLMEFKEILSGGNKYNLSNRTFERLSDCYLVNAKVKDCLCAILLAAVFNCTIILKCGVF